MPDDLSGGKTPLRRLRGASLLVALDRAHRRGCPDLTSCPGCSRSIERVGITQLAYTFEECGCPVVDYTHLIERIWHRRCLRDHLDGVDAGREDAEGAAGAG